MKTFVAVLTVNDNWGQDRLRRYLEESLPSVIVEGVTEEEIVDAEYTWEWRGGFSTMKCKYGLASKVCSGIANNWPDDVEPIDEWVTLADGTELRAKDGVTFDYVEHQDLAIGLAKIVNVEKALISETGSTMKDLAFEVVRLYKEGQYKECIDKASEYCRLRQKNEESQVVLDGRTWGSDHIVQTYNRGATLKCGIGRWD